jgi:hypothetical protein
MVDARNILQGAGGHPLRHQGGQIRFLITVLNQFVFYI